MRVVRGEKRLAREVRKPSSKMSLLFQNLGKHFVYLESSKLYEQILQVTEYLEQAWVGR